MNAPPALFGSARRGRDRRRGLLRRIVVTVAVVGALVAVVSAVGLAQYARTQIDRHAIAALGETDRRQPEGSAAVAEPSADPGTPAAADGAASTPVPEPSPAQADGALTVLVVGTDRDDSPSGEDPSEPDAADAAAHLTDTILVVQVTPAREDAATLAFPGDLAVTPPGHQRMKLDEVHAAGGPDLLVRTLEDYTGVEFDHYVEVDLEAFPRLADAVNGVEVCLEDADVDRLAGVDLAAGCHLLDGQQALRFVRSRIDSDQFGSGNDFGRLARQQYFLREAMTEATGVGTLLNPLRFKRLIDVVADHVVTDESLGVVDLWQVAGALEDVTPEDLDTRVVPGYWDPADTFTHVYPEQAEALFQALRQQAPLPEVGLTDPHDNELTADQVDVLVLNGIGRDGLAGDVAGYLGERGFEVVAAENVQEFNPDMATTTVAHGPQTASKGRLVAQHLPGARLVALDAAPAEGDVVVTVANDWRES